MQTTTFNPIDFGFEWLEDGWYSWDSVEAHMRARKARDEYARNVKPICQSVRKSSTPNQLMTRGGIGSGYPQIEEVVTAYHVTTQ